MVKINCIAYNRFSLVLCSPLQILAAHRCGIRRVLLPQLNLKEVLSEVPAETLACMEVSDHLTLYTIIVILDSTVCACPLYGMVEVLSGGFRRDPRLHGGQPPPHKTVLLLYCTVLFVSFTIM